MNRKQDKGTRLTPTFRASQTQPESAQKKEEKKALKGSVPASGDPAGASGKTADVNISLTVSGANKNKGSAGNVMTSEEVIKIILNYLNSHSGSSDLQRRVLKINEEYAHEKARRAY